MTNDIKNILIVGGFGQMGILFYNLFTKYTKHNITLFDKNDWEKTDIFKKKDLILLSVPINKTLDIIKKVSLYIDENTILADLTSIKKEPLTCMMKYFKGSVLGLHPIFGPTISIDKKSLLKQVIVFCDGRNNKKYSWILKDFKEMGFHLENMKADEHDEAMNFIQGVEHFSVYCLGRFLHQKNVDIEKLTKISSPIYKMELNIVGRLFAQKADLYADIIIADKKRTNFLNMFSNLYEDNLNLVKDNNKELFIKRFEETSKWLGDFSKNAYKESDKIIDLVNKN